MGLYCDVDEGLYCDVDGSIFILDVIEFDVKLAQFVWLLPKLSS